LINNWSLQTKTNSWEKFLNCKNCFELCTKLCIKCFVLNFVGICRSIDYWQKSNYIPIAEINVNIVEQFIYFLWQLCIIAENMRQLITDSGLYFGAHLAPDNCPPEANPYVKMPFLVLLLLRESIVLNMVRNP